MKTGHSVGAKGPYRPYAAARSVEIRLGRPITEHEIQIAAELGWSEWRHVSPKLATLRLRLFLKAKQAGLCMPMEKWPGAPDAGNLHVRCDEGEGAVGESAPLYSIEK